MSECDQHPVELRLALSRAEPAAERLDSMTTIAAEQPTQLQSPQLPQYSRRRILGTWAAAALPMATLAWVIGPWLAGVLEGPSAWFRALALCLTAGLAWQFVLVVVLVRREQGSLSWPILKNALWLRAPRSPRTGRRGGRLWLLLIPLVLALAAEEFLPQAADARSPRPHHLPGIRRRPELHVRELGVAGGDRRDVRLQHGSRRGTAVPRPAAPRMSGAFGRWDGSPTASSSPRTTCTSRG